MMSAAGEFLTLGELDEINAVLYHVLLKFFKRQRSGLQNRASKSLGSSFRRKTA